MVKERAQKKSFQQSLEDIKEKMKEKRNKRLASASAPSRGRSRMINKSSVANSTHTLLMGVQLNNKSLAVALQAEKEKVRQTNAVILQLKREQQALFLHLLLLKRKLKEQEALALHASEIKPPSVCVESQPQVNSARRKRSSQNRDEPVVCEASPICADPQPSEKNARSECNKQVTLPSTVGVRRRHADRSSRRRSERVQETRSLSEGDPVTGLGALIASPILSDDGNQNKPPQGAEPDFTDTVDMEECEHSTPEPAPPKKQQRPSRKQAQQQPRTKPEPAARKPERGRKAERAPLKKPWENPKPRARSKSRDRSATRVKTAPRSQGNNLNTSLGFNDTFDFDCEETVHVTPFRAKAEDNQPATPISEETLQRGRAQTEASPVAPIQIESSLSSPSSESEDSLYVPQKTRRRQNSLDTNKGITTRRGRPSKVVTRKENIPPKQEISVFREESTPKAVEPEKEEAHLHPSPDPSFSNSPDLVKLGQQNPQDPHGGVIEKDCLPPVSPLVEAEMIRIDSVLSNFGDSSGEAPSFVPHQTPQRVKTCKKRGLGVRPAGRGLSLCDVTNMSPAAYRKFSCGGSRPSDARCSTPVPSRKRRCTMVVDYKEPTLNAKLRRGDKFTDLQFLRSPIFKQKSGSRKSVQSSRNSMSSQQPFKKYNESFVGCR
ncbi:shugoshin 1 isoform X1 [Pagrus major]|uniref:shugoshin 1 isoform X1 n=1 Tax=Pagrus major TaxID=143350 RepID=UPI003CC85597